MKVELMGPIKPLSERLQNGWELQEVGLKNTQTGEELRLLIDQVMAFAVPNADYPYTALAIRVSGAVVGEDPMVGEDLDVSGEE